MYGSKKAVIIVVFERIILMNDSWVQLPSIKVTVWYYAPRSFRAQYLTPLKVSLYFILNENLQMSCSRHLDGAVPLLRTNPLMILIDTFQIPKTIFKRANANHCCVTNLRNTRSLKPLRYTLSTYTSCSTLLTSSELTGNRFKFAQVPKFITLLHISNILFAISNLPYRLRVTSQHLKLYPTKLFF